MERSRISGAPLRKGSALHRVREKHQGLDPHTAGGGGNTARAVVATIGRERVTVQSHFKRFAASSTMLRSAIFFTSTLDLTSPRSRVKSTLPCSAARLGIMSRS